MKKEMRTWLATVVAVLLVGCVFAGEKQGEGQIYHATDNSPALKIKNTSKYKCTITRTGDSAANNTVVIGATSTTIDCSDTTVDDVAELAAAIEAATDDDGKTPLVVDTYTAVVTTEATDDELVAEVVVIQQGDIGTLKWTTADVKHYRAEIPKKSFGPSRGKTRVKSVYGSIGGTGDITVACYLDRSEVYRKIIESPIFAWSAAGTTETFASDDITMGEIDIPLDIVVGTDQAFLVTVTRATTAVAGGIGLRTEEL